MLQRTMPSHVNRLPDEELYGTTQRMIRVPRSYSSFGKQLTAYTAEWQAELLTQKQQKEVSIGSNPTCLWWIAQVRAVSFSQPCCSAESRGTVTRLMHKEMQNKYS